MSRADRRASVVVRAFTGRTARVLRQEVAHLPRFAKVLWSPSYFAASCGGGPLSIIREYVER